MTHAPSGARSLLADPTHRTRFDRASKLVAAVGIVVLSLDTWARSSGVSSALVDEALIAIWFLFLIEIPVRWRADRHGQPPYPRTPGALFDALAVALPLTGLLARLSARDVVLLCGIWVLKFTRESTALRLLGRVLAHTGRNLLSVMSVFGVVLFLAALLVHVVERDHQPERFGSIPEALWWATATLTTTGYGDAVPASLPGRILAGLVMVAGIALFALWAGILASGFADEIRRRDFLRNWQMVARVPIFAGLDAQTLAEIVRVLRHRRVAAGAVICRQGEPGEQMFFVAEGEVAVATSPPVLLGPGDFFGELALITGEPRAVSVRASTEVSLLLLDISDFRMLMAQDDKAAVTIRAEAERRLAALPRGAARASEALPSAPLSRP